MKPITPGEPGRTVLDALSELQRRHALLLFLALGAALFTVDHLRRGGPTIVPAPAEIAEAGGAGSWLEEEVLYREALARGLSEGDLIVRRRLVQKMRLLLETGVDVAEPGEASLRDWIDQRAGRYGGVARISLDHVFLSRGRHGAQLDTAAGALRARLPATDAGALTGLSDPHPGGARITQIDARGLERTFGTLLAEQIAELPAGSWQGPLPSSLGLHFVRVLSREVRTPDYAAVRDRARRDYLVEQRREGTRLALDDLKQHYGVAPRGAAP